jgi:hypothetical protein
LWPSRRPDTRSSQGTVKVLKDPEAQQKGGAVPNTASSELVSEEEGDRTPTPSDDLRRGATDAKEGTPPSIKSISAEDPFEGNLA